MALGEPSCIIYLIQVFKLPAIFKMLHRWITGAPLDPVTIPAVMLTVCSGFVVHVGLDKPLARIAANTTRRSARKLAL